jgi:hypothetical protein
VAGEGHAAGDEIRRGRVMELIALYLRDAADGQVRLAHAEVFGG